jgi:hypothetical protein
VENVIRVLAFEAAEEARQENVKIIKSSTRT